MIAVNTLLPAKNHTFLCKHIQHGVIGNNNDKHLAKVWNIPVGMSWDRKNMIPTQSQLFANPSPDQPPLLF